MKSRIQGAAMTFKLIKQEVGPWPMNTYLLADEVTNTSAIIDPGAEAARILSSAESTRVAAIFVTHGHADHVGVLEEVRSATNTGLHESHRCGGFSAAIRSPPAGWPANAPR
jgi:glyoxylase-like metal-dependent hydrolase (beta-lactamase superfamily II)